ncbi:serine O-acetyltransferase [Pseudobacteriovorax antillogorgiicola]|uniref:Serine O-acetyltransferase n=1 Tax=Pseudobacteriovorax antillogorgiicola TaxID=1513793 RepID=A0A1Y6BCU9_9BACT|nr:serine acetyltransferase [Pseudobacteriovorax antillogorgiicola]TCS57427.1 serine O-acetyltransferase [Pseudobacteriovorax antillogorgiicola]SMF01229.1 serine O-acetyltransferase [Pseudobacteriovorax antillogorgiicola]
MKPWIANVSQAMFDLNQRTPPTLCRASIFSWTMTLIDSLFPSRCEKPICSLDAWQTRFQDLDERLHSILQDLDWQTQDTWDSTCEAFFSYLPSCKHQLDQDAQFFLEQDPAANSVQEVVLCYPGFYALAIHRVAHKLYEMNVPLLPRVLSEFAHEKTGIDIHPGAQVDCPLFIDHGTGIVIGETAIVGHHVKIFQGVTLGAPSVKRNLRGKKRHPTIGNQVVLYANATILGGDTHIGDGTIVGGSAWITDSVPAGSRVLANLPN